jgi:hypothetical protein
MPTLRALRVEPREALTADGRVDKIDALDRPG